MPVIEFAEPKIEAVLPSAQKATMPSFQLMAKTAVGVVAVPIALFLINNRPGPALGLLGGLIVGLLMSGMLYAFVNFGLSLFTPPVVAKDQSRNMGQIGGFAVLMIGKFLLVGALLFVMVVVLKLTLLWLVAGFFLTQIATIGATMARLTKTKVTD